jgi:hypothetical protein
MKTIVTFLAMLALVALAGCERIGESPGDRERSGGTGLAEPSITGAEGDEGDGPAEPVAPPDTVGGREGAGRR